MLQWIREQLVLIRNSSLMLQSPPLMLQWIQGQLVLICHPFTQPQPLRWACLSGAEGLSLWAQKIMSMDWVLPVITTPGSLGLFEGGWQFGAICRGTEYFPLLSPLAVWGYLQGGCRSFWHCKFLGLAQTVYGISIYRIYAVYDRIYTV